MNQYSEGTLEKNLISSFESDEQEKKKSFESSRDLVHF